MEKALDQPALPQVKLEKMLSDQRDTSHQFKNLSKLLGQYPPLKGIKCYEGNAVFCFKIASGNTP